MFWEKEQENSKVKELTFSSYFFTLENILLWKQEKLQTICLVFLTGYKKKWPLRKLKQVLIRTEVSPEWPVLQATRILKEETKTETIIKVIIKIFLSWKKYLIIQTWKSFYLIQGKLWLGQHFNFFVLFALRITDQQKSSVQISSNWILFCSFKNANPESFLVVQWLRLHTPNAGGLSSIPGQGTRSHMPQLRPSTAK